MYENQLSVLWKTIIYPLSFCLFLLVGQGALIGQNLVINPSFEERNCCPDAYSQFHCVKGWTTPNAGTSDYFSSCKLGKYDTRIVKTPDNFFGYQAPKDSTSYTGIYCFYEDDYREYVQGVLRQPLRKGEVYDFTVHVSLADDCGLAIRSLGFALLSEPKGNPFFLPLQVPFQELSLENDQYLSDKEGWIKLSASYEAKGGEQFLVIGNFYSNQGTDFISIDDKKIHPAEKRVAYYYLDDVCVSSQKLGGCTCDTLPNLAIEEEEIEAVSTEIEQGYVDLYLFSGDESGLRAPRIGDVAILKNVYFDTDEATLLEASELELNTLFDMLINFPRLEIEIRGHTDNQGKDDYNQSLSEARALAVKNYLVTRSISPSRIQTKGYGERLPISDNGSEKGRQLNRRVEFIVTKK